MIIASMLLAANLAACWQPFTITAYCPCRQCCGSNARGLTASGIALSPGFTLASDWSLLPKGSMVHVAGEWRQVHDKGGAIKGRRLDLSFPNHESAMAFGRQTLPVFIP